MSEKIVKLFNGKHAIIYIDSKDNVSYFIRAIDSEGILVGACNFSITKVFSKPISEDLRIQSAKLRKIPVENVPSSLEAKVTKSNYEKYKNSIVDDILTLENGSEYKYKSSFCDLASIDILDQRFFKVGLGTIMKQEMEQIAKEQGNEVLHDKLREIDPVSAEKIHANNVQNIIIMNLIQQQINQNVL